MTQQVLNKFDSAVKSNEASASFRSPLRYPGGKQKAIAQIAQFLPRSVGEYREPMLGGGSVFFHARSIMMAKEYWVNDKFDELISFWKTVQNKSECAELMTRLEVLRTSFKSADEIKAYFNSVKKKTAESQFEEALLFFFFNRVTFSGTTRAGGFSAAASQSRFTASSIQRLHPMPEAFENVRITNLDFEEVITPPGNDVFIFLDPPYYTANKLYGKNGSLHAFDHEKLASCLQKSGHRFLITYDDCDEIRELYSWAKITDWQLQYGMNNCNAVNSSKLGSELFITP